MRRSTRLRAIAGRQPLRRAATVVVGGLVVVFAVLDAGSVARAGQGTATLAVVVPPGGPIVAVRPAGRPAFVPCQPGSRCTYTLPSDSNVTLEAVGFFVPPFNGWAGACSGTAVTCTLRMDADKEALLRRRLDVAPVRATDGSGGSGTVTISPPGASCPPACRQLYDNETPVTLSAAASAGHFFYRWELCPAGDFAQTCAWRLTEYDQTVRALFLPDATLQVAVTGRAGAVTVSAGGECAANPDNRDCKFPVQPGARVTLTPRAGQGATFAGWSVPECPGTGHCTLRMDARLRTVVAMFSPTELDVNVTGTGTVQSSETTPRIVCGNVCDADYPAFAEVTLTASPASAFRGWSGVCAFAGTSPTCTFRMSGHDDVGAWFAGSDTPPTIIPPRIDYRVQVTRAGDGEGTVRSNRSPRAQEQIECGTRCEATFFEDEVAVLEAVDGRGSRFAGWRVAGGACGADRRCSVDVRRSTRIEATFRRTRCAIRRLGNAGPNRLVGGTGPDALFGRGGRDRLRGLGGDDCLHGGRGNDLLEGGRGADLLRGERGSDTLRGGPGSDVLDGGRGRDSVSAADGTRDRIVCGPGRDSVRADRLDRVSGCERVRRRGT